MSMTKNEFFDEINQNFQPTEREMEEMYFHEYCQRKQWYIDITRKTIEEQPIDFFFTDDFEKFMTSIKVADQVIENGKDIAKTFLDKRKEESHINTPMNPISSNHAQATEQIRDSNKEWLDELSKLSDDLDNIAEDLKKLDNIFGDDKQ